MIESEDAGDRDWSLRQWDGILLGRWLWGALGSLLGLIAAIAFAIWVGGRGDAASDQLKLAAGLAIPLLAVTYLVAYVAAIVCGYRLQRDLHAARLYPHGGWHVVVAAVILNPFFVGLWVPFSVLRLSARVQREQARAKRGPVQ